MTEKAVEEVNWCICIFLINMMMSVIWFMMQVKFHYQIYDVSIGSICFTIV
ncbi:hypothetical protein ACU82A_17695 [Bacillus cereus]